MEKAEDGDSCCQFRLILYPSMHQTNHHTAVLGVVGIAVDHDPSGDNVLSKDDPRLVLSLHAE